MATNSGGNLSTGPELGPNSPSLRLSECLCPICMSILIEPVSMPCGHELCMPCFKQNVEEANFTCPVCRLRISNWTRRAARENRLVNRKRWQEILAAFPEQCRKRLEGEDDDDDYLEDDTELHRKPIVCRPGEIREEYEKEMEKVRKQRREEAEKEVQRSEEYIQMLQQEEVKWIEEQRKEQESLRRRDEDLARKIAEDLNKQEKLERQAEEDERLAWKLHCEEQMLQSPRAVSTVSTSSSSSGGQRKHSNSRSSSNSSVKCMQIDSFLSPAAKNRPPSVSPKAMDINAPGTSKDCVVLTPSPHSNFSFDSDKPGPSGIGQFDISSSVSFLDDSKDRTLTKTPSEQSVCSSESTSFKSALSSPLPALDDLALPESKGEEQSDLLQKFALDEPEKSPRSTSVPVQLEKRSSSVQSHSSTTSAPCTATRSRSKSKETTRGDKKPTEHASRPPQKKGAFHKYTAVSKDDKRTERERSDSLSSIDSISHELSHFRPIKCSPRTARKKLADGRSESPPIIQATPRNLKDIKTPVGTESPFVDPPPLVRAKLEQLHEERHMQVEATSKGTMTSQKVQHWKKIARPEARKSGIVSANTKRKLSKFEYSSDCGFMQPPAKFQRIQASGEGGLKDKRTVGTQKAIPVKKRQLLDYKAEEIKITTLPKTAVNSSKASASTLLESDRPKKSDTNHPPQVPRTVSSISSGTKRKILMDDFVRHKKDKESHVPSHVVSCSSQKHDDTSRLEGVQNSSADSAAPLEDSSSNSETSPSKVYKMKLKSKQNKVGGKELPSKCVTPSKTSSDDVAKRRQTPNKVKRKVNDATPTRKVTDGSGDATQPTDEHIDVNQSPENHRRGLRNQRLRNGTSPGKGILVKTIQNGSKKDGDSVPTRQICNLKSDNQKVRTACSPLNHANEEIRKSESPKVKRSPRSRKSKPVSSPKVSSPRACKNSLSPPPPLVKGTNSVRKSPKGRTASNVKSPRTERRNTLWKYMEFMSEEQKRLQQEEEDRRIAMELQKQFDQQERQNRNKVVRAKGTKDAYRLRHGSSSSVP